MAEYIRPQNEIKTVLVVVRPRLRAFYEYVAPRVFEGASIYYLTENRGDPDVLLDLMELFYYYMDGDILGVDLFSSEEIVEVIRRDRFLRTLELSIAQAMVLAMANAVNDVLSKVVPDVVLSIMTDNYIMDLFERLQSRRSGLYIGTVVSLINGYSRLTRRGELWKCRSSTDEEVVAVYQSLMAKNYKPDILKGSWVTQNRKQMFKAYAKEKLKNIVFPVLRSLKRDHLNFHYNCINGVGATSDRVSKLFAETYYDRDWATTAVNYQLQDVVLIPMQFSPESSIDYMCENLNHINHDEVILEILRNISNDRLVLLKEHPAMVGKKDVAFYQKVKKFNHVKLISPFENMREVIGCCGHVITWSGSTGLEARLMGKHVLCLQKPYYYSEGCFEIVDSLEQIPVLIEKDFETDSDDGPSIIKNLLDGCLPGEVKFIDFDPENNELRSGVDLLIKSMRSSVVNLCDA